MRSSGTGLPSPSQILPNPEQVRTCGSGWTKGNGKLRPSLGEERLKAQSQAPHPP